MEFEAYLISKKIDSEEFRKREPAIWSEWKVIFEKMHPASFTMQKLNLLNPVRRKYTLKVEPVMADRPSAASEQATPAVPENASPPATKPAKPVFKPKPKFK